MVSKVCWGGHAETRNILQMGWNHRLEDVPLCVVVRVSSNFSSKVKDFVNLVRGFQNQPTKWVWKNSPVILIPSLKLTYTLRIGLPKRKVVVQPPFFRGELLVSRECIGLWSLWCCDHLRCLNLMYSSAVIKKTHQWHFMKNCLVNGDPYSVLLYSL